MYHKSLAISKLVHLFSTIPDPPPKMINQLQTICFNFIWKGGSEKIKRLTMYNDYEKGGFKVPDLNSFIMAQKLTWVKKLLDDSTWPDWKTLFLNDVEKKSVEIIYGSLIIRKQVF